MNEPSKSKNTEPIKSDPLVQEQPDPAKMKAPAVEQSTPAKKDMYKDKEDPAARKVVDFAAVWDRKRLRGGK